MKRGAQTHLQSLAFVGFLEHTLEQTRGICVRARGSFINECLSLLLTLGN